MTKLSNSLLFLGCAVLSIMFFGCRIDPIEEPYVATPYALAIPVDFPPMDIPIDNPMTVEGVELGRRLYYDPILSNNGRSCGSCHFQSQAFSSPVAGPGGFSIMAHVNIGWSKYYGWAGGEELLDHVPLADLAEGNAFLNANNDSIKVRFARNADYQLRFKQAYNLDIVELGMNERQNYIAKALAQYMRSQISGNSKYDKFNRSDPNSGFTAAEYRGMQLFFTEKGDCFHCHPAPLFTDSDFHNNGLDASHSGANLGRNTVTGRSSDIGKFKSPTLRNIALTPPYMHDGRFATLRDVVEFYNSGVQRSPTIDPLMTKDTGLMQLNLSQQDVDDLVSFLESLTDTSFTHNPLLSSPF